MSNDQSVLLWCIVVFVALVNVVAQGIQFAGLLLEG